MFSILVKSKILSLGKGLKALFLNPFLEKSPSFTCLQHKSVENTVGKEKLLIMSNFSFSHSVFYPFGELSAILSSSKIVVCKLFQFGSLKFVIWERVKVVQTWNCLMKVKDYNCTLFPGYRKVGSFYIWCCFTSSG